MYKAGEFVKKKKVYRIKFQTSK